MSLSKIVVSGRVIRAPEKRFTPNTNTAVTEFAIAVESPARDGQAESAPVKVITWRDLAERTAQDVKKGDLVAVEGRLQINSYTTSDGQRKRDVEVDASFVENLAQAASSSAEQSAGSTDKVVAGVASRPAGDRGQKNEELDSIFASEDEIPF